MAPTRTTRSTIPWLTAAVIALIAYGSLYPFNFKPEMQDGLLSALGQLSWQRAGRGDRISNVLLYLPLGFCLYLWLHTRLKRGRSLAMATLLGTLLSLAIEVAQVYVSSRVPSLTDLVLNAGGTLLGASASTRLSSRNRTRCRSRQSRSVSARSRWTVPPVAR